MTCTDECPTDSNGVPRGVETFGAAIPTFSDVQGVARYVHEDLVNLQPSRTPAPLHSRHPQVLQKCRDDLDNLKVYTQAAQRWFNKTSVGRFIAIGINPGHHTVSEMEIGYEILPEQELDSGDWLRFQHHRLIPIRAKFTELFLNDQDPKWHHLRTLVDIAWTTFLRQQSKHMQRIAPHSSVIALLPCFRDVIVLGDRTVLDVEELCTFMGQKLLSINRWNVNMEQAVMVQLVERGRDPALVEFYRLEGETIPPPTTDGSRLRDSAMTEVKHFRSANHHHRNDGEVFDYYGLFTRLDSMVYDLNLPEYDKPLWSCGHCSRFVENPATRDQIIDHVARAHEVHAYEHSIPVDYFYVGP
ncbi:hypothetical protein V5O48_003938 [Marasmius crinis-equi]|uniref:Uncharacterized protein n=1 Tax=Marasmius crinis-equi TaxID=585013 RepID=A0ABR3FRY0_9AGAR